MCACARVSVCVCVSNKACLLIGAAALSGKGSQKREKKQRKIKIQPERSHFVAEHKANISALPASAATSLRRRQAAAPLQCVRVRSCQENADRADTLSLSLCLPYALSLGRSRCGVLRSATVGAAAAVAAFPMQRAAVTKMAALKYLTPLSMLRKYIPKATASNNICCKI